MLPDDDEFRAEERSLSLPDSRIKHFWDRDKEGGKLFAKILGLSTPAWDVYLLFDKQTIWDSIEPPEPSFWQHQLSEQIGAGKERRLDTLVFQQRIEVSLAE